MEYVQARRNCKFTCLDCKKVSTDFCRECKNWHFFELDLEVSTMTYSEKNIKLAAKQKQTLLV